LTKGKVGQRVRTCLKSDTFHDNAVDLDHDQSRPIQNELSTASRSHILERAYGRIGARSRQTQKTARSLKTLNRRRKLTRCQANGGLKQVFGEPYLAATPALILTAAVVVDTPRQGDPIEPAKIGEHINTAGQRREAPLIMGIQLGHADIGARREMSGLIEGRWIDHLVPGEADIAASAGIDSQFRDKSQRQRVER